MVFKATDKYRTKFSNKYYLTEKTFPGRSCQFRKDLYTEEKITGRTTVSTGRGLAGSIW